VRGRKTGRGRLGWFYGRFAASRIDHHKYVSRDISSDKNVERPTSSWTSLCAAGSDVLGGLPVDSDMFVYVSFHIYKNVAQLSRPLPLDPVFS
jgi:hypothetical protein